MRGDTQPQPAVTRYKSGNRQQAATTSFGQQFEMRLAVILCLASAVVSRPQDEKDATIINYFKELRENQNYDFSLETSNGIIREESGVSYPGPEPETGSYTQSGSWEFSHPDGTVTYLSFLADENGYRAESDAIPVFTGRVDIQDA